MIQYPFPIQGKERNDILLEITDICSEDYSYSNGNVLNSICTEPIDIAKEIFFWQIASNLGDTRIFKSAGLIENRVTQMLGNLMQHDDCKGVFVTGGSEANLLAMLSAKLKKREISKPNVVLPYSAHFSFDKIATILDIELRYLELDEDYKAKLDAVIDCIDDNTIAIVASAGTSECGAIDPIHELSVIAETNNLYFHIDAASGGFLIPFIDFEDFDNTQCSFKIGKVNSITIDPHKYGLSVIPGGYLLFQSVDDYDRIAFQSHYKGTKDHHSITGTKSGASIMALYATIINIGFKGYSEIANSYISKRKYLLKLMAKYNFDSAFKPDLNIVGIKCENIEQISQEMEYKGWLVSISKRNNFLRIVIANHVSFNSLELFMNDLCKVRDKINSDPKQIAL